VNTSFSNQYLNQTPIKCEKGKVEITWTYYLYFSDNSRDTLSDFNKPDRSGEMSSHNPGFANEMNHKHYTEDDPIRRGNGSPKAEFAETKKMKIWWNWCDKNNRKTQKVETDQNWPVVQRRW
jgi:hypothetical protein